MGAQVFEAGLVMVAATSPYAIILKGTLKNMGMCSLSCVKDKQLAFRAYH